jgi:hypothetical protein
MALGLFGDAKDTRKYLETIELCCKYGKNSQKTVRKKTKIKKLKKILCCTLVVCQLHAKPAVFWTCFFIEDKKGLKKHSSCPLNAFFGAKFVQKA